MTTTERMHAAEEKHRYGVLLRRRQSSFYASTCADVIGTFSVRCEFNEERTALVRVIIDLRPGHRFVAYRCVDLWAN